MTNNSPEQSEAPLEDIMVAMDVVDTLRHQQGIAERELDSGGRRERLLSRLREMYTAQGIEVPDHVLKEGIEALEQERFEYKRPEPSWRTKLARIWITRGRWGKPVGFLAVVGSLFSGFYVVNDVLPEREMRAAIPKQLETSMQTIEQIAKNSDVIAQAKEQAALAQRAIDSEDFDEAKGVLSNMQSVVESLESEYTIRVVSRANENSGIWRVPPNNPRGRNYYLIVEAIDKRNKVVAVDVLNQENNKRERKKAWGLRVNETTFQKISADKRDDGIIQNNRVGQKALGYLTPTFNIGTTGATITEW